MQESSLFKCIQEQNARESQSSESNIMERWAEKVALVTGASSGIGASIALELAREGMKVVGIARRLEKLQEVHNQLGEAKGSLHIKQFDISKIDDIPQLFEDIKNEFGEVDVLVNNAGIFRGIYNLTDAPTQDMVDVINTNLLGLAVASREAVRQMKAKNQPGHIININSTSGHRVPLIPGISLQIYSPSKFAVTALSKISGFEMAMDQRKIKFTSISPGVVDTEIFKKDNLPKHEEMKNDFPSLSPSDIADAVKYVLGTPENVLISELTIQHIHEKI